MTRRGRRCGSRCGAELQRHLLAFVGVHQFGGGLTDEVFERTSKVRLVEVAECMNGVENGVTFLQEGGSLTGAFNLLNGGVGQPCGM